MSEQAELTQALTLARPGAEPPAYRVARPTGAPGPGAGQGAAAPAGAHGVTVCAVTLIGWTVVLMLNAFALHRDALGSDQGARLQQLVQAALPSVLVLALASCALALAFERWSESMLRPAAIARIGVLACAAAVPLAAAASAGAQLWAEALPIDRFAAQLASRDAFLWWIDACLAIVGFLTQAGYAAWRRGQLQESAWLRARDEGMALRLRLLQGQLKPHFLFNSLNGISALVRTADRELAARALAQLSALLRYVVDASRHEWLSVADELAFVRDYLDLQTLRYGERMTIEFSVADAPWQRLACPPLLFQPLVENAIQHGVEPHRELCCVRIRLELAHGMVCLRIDNPVFESARARGGHGLGQAATRERLAILYGAAARIDVQRHGTGYTATLAFPARPYDEH